MADDPHIGALIAERYLIVERAGEGSAGMVYRGVQVALQRPIAVKLLHAELSGNAEILARFEREALAAARIEHPNVVAVYDFGRTAEGQMFLVMEYVPGGTLRELLAREGALPWTRALRIARHVAAALDRAHAAGVVHRDVKPENVVLVAREGDPEFAKVIDFGIARLGLAEEGGTALTRAGMVYGTPGYMAPEQSLGVEVDARADLYAFAVMVFEMLAGKLPIEGDDVVELMSKHLTEERPRLSERGAPGVSSPAVDEVLQRAMSRAPKLRYASATALLDALDAARAASAQPAALAPTIPAPPGTRWRTEGRRAMRRAESWARANPRHAGAAGLALGMLVGGATLAPALMRHRTAAAQQPVTLLREEAASVAPTPTSTPAGDPLMARLAAFRARPEVAAAYATGRGRGLPDAIAAMERLRAATPGDAMVFLALAELHGRDRARLGDAAVLYAEALRREPGLAREPSLPREVARIFTDAHPAAPEAEALLRGPLSAAALDALLDAMSGARTPDGRARALTLVRDPAFAPRLDATSRALVALAEARTCAERRTAVEVLGRDGDARALAPLRRVHTGSGCGFLGLGDCNGCLSRALPLAVAAIEARRGDAGAP